MRLRRLLYSVCSLAICFAAYGQETESCSDYRYRVDTDPYLFLTNPAALSLFGGHISMAELSFRKDNGGLISLSESSDSYEASALTESYVGISDRISFYGKLCWSYFGGQDMGGQILIDPDFNPVNFLESSETTTGFRQKENYNLSGAMSYRPDERWALGAGIEYTSADQTKVKDPRFSSIWMDMKLRAGVSFRPSEKALLGLALVYRSTLEQLRGGIYGTTDKQYFVFTDKGGFLGTMAELAGDYNYIYVSSQRPMKNDFYGVSFQAVSGGFSNELDVLYRNGYYGKKSSSTATFFEFSGIKAGYRGQLLARSGTNLHRATLSLGYELLGNNENQFKYVTPVGQDTRVEYYGRNHIMDSHRFDVSLGYVWYKDAGGYLPSFVAGAAASGKGLLRKTELYPYYRNSSRLGISAEAYARKNVIRGKSIFSAGAKGGFCAGFGERGKDGSYTSTSGTSLQSFDGYLNRQYEFDTAPRLSAELELAYTRRFTAKLAAFVKLSDGITVLTKAPQYLSGRVRNVALISLGCNF